MRSRRRLPRARDHGVEIADELRSGDVAVDCRSSNCVQRTREPAGGIDGSTDDSDSAPAFDARRQHHPVRLDAHQLRRLQVRHDHDRPADELIGLIRLGDAGDDRPLLRADVHLQLDQLLRLRNGFGSSTFATRSSTFMKSSIEMPRIGRRRRRRGAGAARRSRRRSGVAAGGGGAGGGVAVLVMPRSSSRVFSMRGNSGLDRPSCGPGRKRSRLQDVHGSCCDAEHPRMRSAAPGITGSTARRHPQRVGRVIQRRLERRPLASSLASVHGSRSTMYLLTRADQLPGVLQRARYLKRAN